MDAAQSETGASASYQYCLNHHRHRSSCVRWHLQVHLHHLDLRHLCPVSWLCNIVPSVLFCGHIPCILLEPDCQRTLYHLPHPMSEDHDLASRFLRAIHLGNIAMCILWLWADGRVSTSMNFSLGGRCVVRPVVCVSPLRYRRFCA